MSSSPRRLLAVLPLAIALFAVSSLAGPRFGERTARAQDMTVQLIAGMNVGASGDGKARIEIIFGPAVFPKVKANSPDPRKFLQSLAPDRADYEMSQTSARYDDVKGSVVLDMTERAAAKNRGGGRWELESEPTATLDRIGTPPGGGPTAWFRVKGDWGDGVKYQGQFTVVLPVGATEVHFDEGTKVLSWQLTVAASAGAPRMSAELRTRDRMMSSIYKVYGLGSDLQAFWLAKTIFRNDGKGVARNLRVRYRLQGYSDWSPWEKHPEVVPGQTVVSVLYPVLDASIAKLKTNTPANLLLEYTYEDDAGKRFEDDASKKLVILGVNEFVFGNLTSGASFGTWQEDYNNAPLLAAWVSRNDAVIKQFASMANRMAGGVGASTNDASALKVLKACYELLQANDFTYQHPPALEDKTVSFDPKNVQNVKYPRETIRDRSGTCIDLAILYAAMVNAIGLEPHLALIPGHCFPLIRLPSGRVIGVETTGIQGGLRTGSAPFERAQPYADKEYKDAQADGKIYEIDVRSLWTRGISNPEFEEAPSDILERWGISEEGRAGHRKPSTPGPGTPTTPDSGSATGPDAAVGLWGGAIGSDITGGKLDAFVIGIDKADQGYDALSRADLTLTSDGRTSKMVVITKYTGKANGDGILFESTERTRAVDGGEAVLLVQAFMRVRATADRIEARVGNDAEGYTDFTLVRKPNEAPAESALADPVRGSWGGDMSKAKLGDSVTLDEMYIDVPADGTWRATVKMNVTIHVPKKPYESGGGDIAAVILVECVDGVVDGDSVRWAKVPWHRTIPSTGQKTDIEGNPLVLKVTADGILDGAFEGGDGFTFTLRRRGAAPTRSVETRTNFAATEGKWGGELHLAIDDGVVESLVIAIAKSGEGKYVAATRGVYTVVNQAQERVRILIVGRYDGRVEGDKIVFQSTSRQAGREDAATLANADPSSLEVAPVDGKIQGRIGNDKDGWMTFTLSPKKD